MRTSKPLKDIRRSLHNLAQPLATVTGLVDLLLLEAGDNHPWHQELMTIQLEKALDIIGEIRRIAREASDESVSAASH
jgi:signal transduction histidine kinase